MPRRAAPWIATIVVAMLAVDALALSETRTFDKPAGFIWNDNSLSTTIMAWACVRQIIKTGR